LFFVAFDGASGSELWRSDGTSAGTVRVADINPGGGFSSPTNLTAVGNTLFFTANDGSSGYELWRSNGTAAGTVRVADINPGVGSSSPNNLTAVGNTLFFTADDGSSGSELWSLDVSLFLDTTPPIAPSLSLAADTGTSSTDRITSNRTINVAGLEAGASWEFSTDSGSSWLAGSGSSFSVADGSYATGQVQARQTDSAGNTGPANSSFAAFSIAPDPITKATRSQDLLIGTPNSSDTFRWSGLSFSLREDYDTITNYEDQDRLRVRGSRYRSTLTSTEGSIRRLSGKQIKNVLGGRDFSAGEAAAFKVQGMDGTFIALNNDQRGFQSNSDALIFLEGYSIGGSNPVIVA
ncbi:MAG: hypothetical protein MUD04_13290, partial [Cyanobium sp. Prado107]|nr:hypothetical protein [Cyanobium sp. Prado107]